MKKVMEISILILLIALVFSLYIVSYAGKMQNDNGSFFTIPGIGTSITATSKTTEPEPVIQLSQNCTADSDCSWTSVNCCSENAGAKWECINERQSVIQCTKVVLCPQFLSPKPNNDCKCISGVCTS